MRKILKENWFKLIIIVFIVVIFGGLFYWYELRPVQIKKDCSWVKQVQPAQQEVTKAQAIESQKKYEECLKENLKRGDGMYKSPCDMIYLKKEQDYVPESTYYREAFKTEYDFCVNSKGL